MNIENLKKILTTYWFAAQAEWERKNERRMNTNVRQAINHMKVTSDFGVVYQLLVLHRDLGLETILTEESVTPHGEDSEINEPPVDLTPAESAPVENVETTSTEPEVGQGLIDDIETNTEENHQDTSSPDDVGRDIDGEGDELT